MPWHTKSTVRRSGMQPAACRTLVVLACIALASCGGGPGAVHPDLVVEGPSVSDDRPAAGASFTFSATVRNAGSGDAAPTTLRVHRSDDATFTTSDPQVGSHDIPLLRSLGSANPWKNLDSRSTVGTRYYRVCADVVAGESDTTDNCSRVFHTIWR